MQTCYFVHQMPGSKADAVPCERLRNIIFFKIKRFRCIYHIDDQTNTLIVCAIGLRRDIHDVITELVH